ncbi:hypothetical protein AB0J72_54945 [Dactylosporangium sp. NPDC049742]|uniref:hypothetical protein n=1 Tax=Dactylosporangium sp. NPDC049742 TaxID=3154737 RepID=UPI0034344BD5
MDRRFPPHPVRGVRVRHSPQTGGTCVFADVTVDFEPASPGFAFTVAEDVRYPGYNNPEALSGYRAALAEGLSDALADRVTGAVVAVTVVLRILVAHKVDSSERSFRTAGHLAVHVAFDRIESQ